MPSLSAILVTFDNTAAKVKINKEINPTGNKKLNADIHNNGSSYVLFTSIIKLVADITSGSFFEGLLPCGKSICQWKVGLVHTDADVIEAVRVIYNKKIILSKFLHYFSKDHRWLLNTKHY